MHPDQLAGQRFGGDLRIPVRVQGFRRSFSQEPSWRIGEAHHRGVLTLHASDNHWFNGILTAAWDAETISLLDHRERGYLRQILPSSAVQPYHPDDAPFPAADIHVYTGRPHLRNDALAPNAAYRQLCLDAANRWGGAFLRDFQATTYVGDTPLCTP